jgi:hypothetical protein
LGSDFSFAAGLLDNGASLDLVVDLRDLSVDFALELDVLSELEVFLMPFFLAAARFPDFRALVFLDIDATFSPDFDAAVFLALDAGDLRDLDSSFLLVLDAAVFRDLEPAAFLPVPEGVFFPDLELACL